MREMKLLELINLRQGNMSMKEYALKFNQLAKAKVERAKESKRAKTSDGYFSHSRSDGHGHPQFWQKFSGQVSSNALDPKLNTNRVYNPKPQVGNDGNGSSNPTCPRYGTNHSGKCLACMDSFFGCGKSGHKVKNYPLQDSKAKDGREVQPSCPCLGAPKQNKLYTLLNRQDCRVL
ncbi:hypothetical protein MTR67_026860 [Solanum verrucosum]|uniref:Retrotransposon gag domain-containing protein n=1 Tax=Solanum verrucosum TaxID=315347 RepID=A0AAF0TZC9_SOLVR|nr:hypothetical protein MTR67_026860 [Solanum verrucosum]